VPLPAQSLLRRQAGNRVPVAPDRSAIIGLCAPRELSYVLLDDLRQEAEFSLRQSFEPTQPQCWSQYPMTIQEDTHGYPSLFVDLPVAGWRLRAQLDTGSTGGLAITDRL
jgi:hypothetical protein